MVRGFYLYSSNGSKESELRIFIFGDGIEKVAKLSHDLSLLPVGDWSVMMCTFSFLIG